MVIVRFTKFGNFVPLLHPYTTAIMATLFMNNIFKLHGLLKSIVSDKDLVFLSSFWTSLFSLQGTELNHNSAYHPQSDGQIEALNNCLEGYLRCYSGLKPKKWVQWLVLAEWWYNTFYHNSIKLTPFEALYGYPPLKLLSYIPNTSANQQVDLTLCTREQITQVLKENLKAAQN